MERISPGNWQSVVVSPGTVIQKIKPGMSIFLGTAVVEPRTPVQLGMQPVIFVKDERYAQHLVGIFRIH
jgi:hypothetical protein